MSRLNPLTLFFSAILFLILTFKAETSLHLIWLATSLGLMTAFTQLPIRVIARRVKPFLYFMPVMLILYLPLAVVLSGTGIEEQLRLLALPISRIFLMLSAMTIFLEFTSTAAVLDVVRTIWFKAEGKWRWVENSFQMLYLVFRFFPMFRDEFSTRQTLDKALCFNDTSGRFFNIFTLAHHLPAVVSNIFHRAENLGMSMTIRGFGTKVPRGVAQPRSFGFSDLAAAGICILFILGFRSLA